jgi:hypothetical protein
VVGVALVSTPLGAQQGQDEADRLACFRIRPLPACRGYWLVEVQGVVPIASTKQTDVFRGSVDVFDDNNLEFNLGYMLNVSRSLSGGGAIVLGSGSGGDEPWAGGAASGLSLGASASSGGALVVSTLIGLGLVLMMFALSGGT